MEISIPQIVAVDVYNSHIAQKGRAASKNRRTTMFEIELPLSDGGISYIDDVSAPIRANTIIFAKPGQTRHTRFPLVCYYVHMIVEKGPLFDKLSSLPDYINTEKVEKYTELFKRIIKYYGSAIEEDELLLSALILELMHLALSDSERNTQIISSGRGGSKAVEEAISYIKKNLTEDLSLEKLSGRFGFSPIYFHKLFKRSTGRTLRDYVEEQRIKKAANMIVSTEYTLTQIAYECGFSSQSYFSYAFKRRMNATPRQYALNVFKKYEQ